ncbi:unnamed protein product [Darwinula stevensoni]|uniref:Beta-1,4-glucuronyltransferase 1 n=1 Tax=Darwinula stevensoni TaxID=69355 RepID=A0A7R8XC34_9CRUS|nr:unnamed protein product [Darwinula stevensoni]CAG0893396.1 unnamed protein product [Darwinula stevensoni]
MRTKSSPRRMISLAFKAGSVEWINRKWTRQRPIVRILKLVTLLLLACPLAVVAFDWCITVAAVRLAPSLVHTSNVGERSCEEAIGCDERVGVRDSVGRGVEREILWGEGQGERFCGESGRARDSDFTCANRRRLTEFGRSPSTLSTQLYGSGVVRQAKGLFPGMALDRSGDYGILQEVARADGDAGGLDVTWVTQASIDHIHRVAQIAAAWQGPISFVVFTSTPANIGITLRVIQCLRNEHPLVSEHATFHIVFPVRLMAPEARLPLGIEVTRASCRDILRQLALHEGKGGNYIRRDVEFPHNLLRNVGRLAAGTEFVFVADTDFLPSQNMRLDFVTFAKKGDFSTRGRDKTVYVVPSFEAEPKTDMPQTKSDLIELWNRGIVRPFYTGIVMHLQGWTDYLRWKALPAAPEMSVGYEVEYGYMYEPFFIARNSAPLFDERFRQQGWDRNSHACELYMGGYTFAVLDNAFIVHDGFKQGNWETSPETREDLRINAFRNRGFRTQLLRRYARLGRSCNAWETRHMELWQMSPSLPSYRSCVIALVIVQLFLLSTFRTFSGCVCEPPIDRLGMTPPLLKADSGQTSNEGQDPSEGEITKRIIVPLFPVQNRCNKFFVEAGALDGRTISKTLHLEETYKWTGLLVEPNPHLFKKMTEQKRNAWLAPYCLSPELAIMQEVMEYPYDPNDPIASWGGGISKYGKVKGPVKNGTTIYSALVTCYPLHMLLDALGIKTVHFFSLDVEGLELEVLKTLPFYRIDFQVIQVEFLFNDMGKEPLRNFLLSLGYTLLKEEGGEFIFVNVTAPGVDVGGSGS